MEKVNYRNLTEIKVSTQEELDAIPDNFKGRIYIESDSVIHINKKYYWPVIARGISSVIARDNTHVVAKDNAYIEAWDDSHVVARDYSRVEARENSIIKAWDNSSVQASGKSNVMALGHSSVEAWENSHVEAWENSNVRAWDSSYVEAREFSYIQVVGKSNIVAFDNSTVMTFDSSYIAAFDNSRVIARKNSHVVARKNSHVEAWDNSYVEAFDNSYIEAWENSNIIATSNVQVIDRQSDGKIKTSGNARVVRMLKNISEFLDFYNIKHTDTKAIFYKAVHKTNKKNVFVSDYDSCFTYVVGKVKTENCNINTDYDCTSGIHISYLEWALNFGSDWDDLAIIECETKISDIVMPENTDGKVRTSKIKVLREVPLEECGTYGKILVNNKK